ncbi:hypothetical protein [Glycomyces tarimensis]
MELEHESLEPEAPVSSPGRVPVGARPLPGSGERSFAEELEGFARWLRWEWGAMLRALGRAPKAEPRRERRPWIAPPRVTLEDRELPAAWGLNEFRLPAGSGLVEIAVPAPAGLVDAGTAVELRGDATLLYELDLQPGTATTIEARARVTTRMNEDGTALAEYRGRIEAVRGPWSDVQ